MLALEAGKVDLPAETEWARLERLSEGSVRRLVQLASTGGLKIQEQTLDLVRSLPRIEWSKAHVLIDEVAANGADVKLEAFFDNLLGTLARMVRAGATGRGDPEDARLAAKLIQPDALASWAELWETIAREKVTAMGLNLDRKALVLDTLVKLEARARG